MKATTYGMPQEKVSKIGTQLYFQFLEGAIKGEENEDIELALLKDMMVGYPKQAKFLIMGTLVFAVGNFDRFDKIELTGEVDADGKFIDVEPLKRVGIA